MTRGGRRVALACARTVPLHSAAAARLMGLEAAFREAGWEVERMFLLGGPKDSSPTRRLGLPVPERLRAMIGRIGGVGELRPGELLLQIRALRRETDLVVVSVPPFSLIAATAVTRAPIVIDYRDVLSTSVRPHVLGRLLGPLERRAASRAAGITFAGTTRGLDLLRRATGIRNGRARLVLNGVAMSDLAGISCGRNVSAAGPLDLVLAGHLYGGSDLTPLLKAIADVGPEIARLEVVGPTPSRTRARFGSLPNAPVEYSAPLDRRLLYERLARADAGVLVLNDSYPYEVSIPAKLYDYAAARLPTIFVGPPAAGFLHEDLGVTVHAFDPSDAPGLRRFLRDAAANRSIIGSASSPPDLDRAARARPLVELGEELV